MMVSFERRSVWKFCGTVVPKKTGDRRVLSDSSDSVHSASASWNSVDVNLVRGSTGVVSSHTEGAERTGDELLGVIVIWARDEIGALHQVLRQTPGLPRGELVPGDWWRLRLLSFGLAGARQENEEGGSGHGIGVCLGRALRSRCSYLLGGRSCQQSAQRPSPVPEPVAAPDVARRGPEPRYPQLGIASVVRRTRRCGSLRSALAGARTPLRDHDLSCSFSSQAIVQLVNERERGVPDPANRESLTREWPVNGGVSAHLNHPKAASVPAPRIVLVGDPIAHGLLPVENVASGQQLFGIVVVELPSRMVA